jgi:hypothetical protein
VTTTEFVDTGDAESAGAVPTTTGTTWVVKNLFELKSARNVIVESNIFENHWRDGQPGYAVDDLLETVGEHDSGHPLSATIPLRVPAPTSVLPRLRTGISRLTGNDPLTPPV